MTELIEQGRGLLIDAGGLETNFHDRGSGDPVVLLHGSGPGVSAWTNWKRVIPALSDRFRVIAPDYVQGRALVTDGARIDSAQLADAKTALKELHGLAAP
jgi:pimeloyl-ACP methyl ester carboxylesterase